MERIIIIGCSGSGKSTLSVKLGQMLQLPVVHLDKLWWRPGWEHISREEFNELLACELEKEKWIMDGDFSRTLPQRLKRCDTVIWLDFSRIACICGVCKRVLTTYGKVRPDMGDGCPERFNWDFLKWVWTYNERNRETIHSLLQETTHVQKYVFQNRRQLNRFLKKL